MKKDFKAIALKVKKIRKRTGLPQQKFAARFGIPITSYERWEYGGSAPPLYVLDMLNYILDLEEKVRDLEGRILDKELEELKGLKG